MVGDHPQARCDRRALQPGVRLLTSSLAISGLTKTYGPTVAVDDVTLRIATGEMVALLGPSGCGKTTILRMIAGLVAPTEGQVFIGGQPMRDVPVHKRNIGMLFQNYALFPHLDVAQNVAFGLQMRGVARADIGRRVQAALDLVRLGAFGTRLPSALSGGQQQRVALARALVIEPSVLLLDEPLGALDKGLRESMQVELRQLQKRLGITSVMVTHDQEEALTLADRIVVMQSGRLAQVGTPEDIYARPATRFVAEFTGASNLLSGHVAAQDGRTVLVELAGRGRLSVPGSAQGDVTVCVRPEAIRVHLPGDETATANSLPAIVDQVIYRGSVSHIYLRLADGSELVAFRQNRSGQDAAPELALGSRVVAQWEEGSNHLLACR